MSARVCVDLILWNVRTGHTRCEYIRPGSHWCNRNRNNSTERTLYELQQVVCHNHHKKILFQVQIQRQTTTKRNSWGTLLPIYFTVPWFKTHLSISLFWKLFFHHSSNRCNIIFTRFGTFSYSWQIILPNKIIHHPVKIYLLCFGLAIRGRKSDVHHSVGVSRARYFHY